jgi:hypothetical protein
MPAPYRVQAPKKPPPWRCRLGFHDWEPIHTLMRYQRGLHASCHTDMCMLCEKVRVRYEGPRLHVVALRAELEDIRVRLNLPP